MGNSEIKSSIGLRSIVVMYQTFPTSLNKMIATPETNTDCFRDTIIAYRVVRQSGEKDLPAYYSAREAYRSHQPNDPDEARNISAIISTASKKDPKRLWRGVANK